MNNQMSLCEQFREFLDQYGISEYRTNAQATNEGQELLKHLDTCPECKAYLVATEEIEKELSTSPFDASDQLVTSLLSQVAAEMPAAKKELQRKKAERINYLLAGVAGVSLIVIGLTWDKGIGSVATSASSLLNGATGVVIIVSASLAAVICATIKRTKEAGNLALVALCFLMLRTSAQNFSVSNVVRDGEARKASAPSRSGGLSTNYNDERTSGPIASILDFFSSDESAATRDELDSGVAQVPAPVTAPASVPAAPQGALGGSANFEEVDAPLEQAANKPVDALKKERFYVGKDEGQLKLPPARVTLQAPAAKGAEVYIVTRDRVEGSDQNATLPQAKAESATNLKKSIAESDSKQLETSSSKLDRLRADILDREQLQIVARGNALEAKKGEFSDLIGAKKNSDKQIPVQQGSRQAGLAVGSGAGRGQLESELAAKTVREITDYNADNAADVDKNGDYGTEHREHLSVLNQRASVEDAFNLEAQLGKSGQQNVPYVQEADLRKKNEGDKADLAEREFQSQDAGKSAGSSGHGSGAKLPVFKNESKPNSQSSESGQVNSNEQPRRSLSDLQTQEKAKAPAKPASAAAPLAPESLAQAFLNRRASVDGLSYLPATGYWSNTYVPGDSDLLRLGLLLKNPTSNTIPNSIDPAAIASNVRRPAQPFDLPQNSAIAVYLNSDKATLLENGKTRMLLQVGVQATQRHSGARPAMNMAVVLDLRGEVSDLNRAQIEALMQAISKAKASGDRFSLIVAGRPGGTLIKPTDFRHGTLTVALASLFGKQAVADKSASVETYSVAQALKAGIDVVSSSDNPQAALGSSSVLFVTDNSLSSDINQLSSLAHESAVAGIPVSVVGVGTSVQNHEVNQLALSGQGNRRFLTKPEEAPSVIEREFTALSKVVARALRLRIHLAPGVNLVDMVGAIRLDAVASQQVRQAEQSIDQRISKNLGIQADRGQDEEGIQVVIPAFLAGDTHTILLDVVASNPGQVAEVSARYKDLVFLNNGTARAELSLAKGKKKPAVREANVLRNYLAFEIFQNLSEAANDLRRGSAEAAFARVMYMKTLLDGLSKKVVELGKDADVQRDLKMLEQYGSLLQQVMSGNSVNKALLSDSLEYSGKLKVLPKPEVQ